MPHNSALTQVPAADLLPQIQPRSASLAQQLIHLLQQVLVLAGQHSDVPVPGRRRRGRPVQLPLSQVYLALVLGVLRHTPHLSTIWRRLYLEAIGSWPPVHVTYEALRKRVLAAGTGGLEQLFELVCQGLAQWSQRQQPSALSLAPFATQVVALDETTLDQVRRLTAELHELPAGDPHLLPACLISACNAGCGCNFAPMCWPIATSASCSCWTGWPQAASSWQIWAISASPGLIT